MNNYVNKYEPPIYTDNDTMEGIYQTESEEIEKIHNGINRTINNNFIKTADLHGVEKYEKELNIQNNINYTLEERRLNVLNKMLFHPPYTRQKLNEILYNVYGQGGYIFEIIPDKFQVKIEIDSPNPIQYLNFSKQVRQIIPANMEIIYTIQYTYIYLNQFFTYAKLSEGFTYKELSRYSTDIVRRTIRNDKNTEL